MTVLYFSWSVTTFYATWWINNGRTSHQPLKLVNEVMRTYSISWTVLKGEIANKNHHTWRYNRTSIGPIRICSKNFSRAPWDSCDFQYQKILPEYFYQITIYKRINPINKIFMVAWNFVNFWFMVKNKITRSQA